MRIQYKMIVLAILLVIITLFINTSVMADINLDTMKPTTTPNDDSGKIKEKSGKVLGAIRILGSGISVICLAILGIKYMIGSAEEKAEYKKSMVPFVIGAVLLFATTNLIQIIYKIGASINI